MKEYIQVTSVTTTMYDGGHNEAELFPGTDYGTEIISRIKVYTDTETTSEAVVSLEPEGSPSILLSLSELKYLVAEMEEFQVMIERA